MITEFIRNDEAPKIVKKIVCTGSPIYPYANSVYKYKYIRIYLTRNTSQKLDPNSFIRFDDKTRQITGYEITDFGLRIADSWGGLLDVYYDVDDTTLGLLDFTFEKKLPPIEEAKIEIIEENICVEENAEKDNAEAEVRPESSGIRPIVAVVGVAAIMALLLKGIKK